MANKLECKIGTGLYNDLKQSHRLDGRSRSIIVSDAWRKRCLFNSLAKRAGRLWKNMMLVPSSNGYEVGVA